MAWPRTVATGTQHEIDADCQASINCVLVDLPWKSAWFLH